MKQSIPFDTEDVSPFVRQYITLWKEKKKYSSEQTLTVGEAIELLIATSYTYYQDDSDGRFFNNVLRNEESLIAWDGEELIDILFYQVVQNIRRRLKNSRTFNSEE